MQETILIVGGTSGLGRRLCELYCLDGNKVGIVGRRQSLLHELKLAYPDQINTFCYDIGNENCTRDILDFINEMNGIDKLILTASIVDFNPKLSFDIEKKIIAINTKGYAAVLNASYHYFSQKGVGHIVGITSTAAARSNKTTIAYNASKAFQSFYLEGLRLKLESESKFISVTELIPGYMDTDMARGDRLFWMSKLDKAALQSKASIEAKKRRAFITRRWQIVYLLYKLLPDFVYSRLINSKIKFRIKRQ